MVCVNRSDVVSGGCTSHELFEGIAMGAQLPILQLSGLGIGEVVGYGIMVLFGIFGVYLVVTGFGVRVRKLYHIYSGTPSDMQTIDPHSGLVEISGTATAYEETVVAPLSRNEALIAKHTYTRDKTTRTNESQMILDEGDTRRPFLVEDSTGKVLVDPDGADVLGQGDTTTINRSEYPPDRIQTFLEENDLRKDRDDTRHFTEVTIEPGDEVYVLGETTDRTEKLRPSSDVDAVITGDGEMAMFTISPSPETVITKRVLARTAFQIVLGLVFVVVGLMGVLGFLGGFQ